MLSMINGLLLLTVSAKQTNFSFMIHVFLRYIHKNRKIGM